MLNQDLILNTLKTVKYPGFSRDIVSFGLIKELAVAPEAVRLRLQLTTHNPDIARQIQAACEQVLKNLPELKQVKIEVSFASGPPVPPTAQDPWASQSKVAGVKRVVAIASGKGGVGKSTCAVNLACALARLGAATGLLDCDIYGPSIPLMMGLNERPEIDQEMLVPPLAHGVKLMSIGFLLEGDTPVIWRGPMIVKTIQQFLHQVRWAELDYLIVDLPPGTGDAQLTLCQTVPLDGGLMVTTPQPAALSVVRKGMAMFEKVNVPLLGLLENMSYFVTPSGDRVEIFGHGGGRAEAARKHIPFLGEIPLYTEIREGGDRGVPVVVSAPTHPSAQAFIAVAETLRKRLG